MACEKSEALTPALSPAHSSVKNTGPERAVTCPRPHSGEKDRPWLSYSDSSSGALPSTQVRFSPLSVCLFLSLLFCL